MRHSKKLGALVGLFFSGLLGATAAHAQGFDETVTLESGRLLYDFECGKGPKKPPTPQPAPEPSVPAQVPTKAELGSLARMVTRNPPVLDAEFTHGFDLTDSKGRLRPRRFAFWGDSHIAAGPMMHQLFEAIRSRGATVGTRFLPPTMGRSNVRLPMMHDYCIGDSWTTDLAWKAKGEIQVGPGLANRIVSAAPDAYVWLDLRTADLKPQIRQLQIAYLPTAAGATLELSVNDGPAKQVRLGSGGSGNGFLTVRSDELIYTLKIQVVAGTFAMQGFLLDYAKPPLVTLDVFGIPGGTAQGWGNADPAYIAASLRGDTYDAVVLEYGTNEGNGPNYDPAQYRTDLSVTLAKMRRAFPKASCILVGPPDRGVLINRGGGGGRDLLKYARIHKQIASIQAELAPNFGCAVWNWQDYMGGPGGAYGWIYNSPALMGKDLTHLSMDGYRRTGRALATSLGWASADR